MRTIPDRPLTSADLMTATDPVAHMQAVLGTPVLVADVDDHVELPTPITHLRPLRLIQGGAARPFAVGTPNLEPCA